jgi:hypothetical protein
VRRIVTSLVVLLVLLGVGDRVSVALAERALAERITAEDGVGSASTKVRGFPFLTQAVRGRYDRVDVEARDIDRGGVRVAELDATLTGIQAPLGEVVRGEVTAVPVDDVRATALVTYLDLAHRSGLVGVAIEPLDGEVRVTGRVSVLGQQVTASATSRVTLRGDAVVVTARSIRVLGQSTPALVGALAGLLDLRVPVGRLPYGLRLTGVRATAGGLVLSAEAHDTVLRAA